MNSVRICWTIVGKEKVEEVKKDGSVRDSKLDARMRNFLDGKVLCRLIENLGARKEDMVGFDETAKAESFKGRQNDICFKSPHLRN